MHSEYEEDADWENLMNLKIFRESVCLIRTDTNLTLKIEEDAMRELEQIDKELNVVAITGLYRTGKSVLLNHLARKETPVFGVGHATSAMTRGIWASCLRHPNNADQVLMLLDTEGLGDIRKGSQHHDNKLFTIATLLSSTLLYNIIGPFNQDALEKLTFITQASENVALSGNIQNEAKLIESFPTFVLCMRDFFLNIHDRDGAVMTPKEYLEECLQSKLGGGVNEAKFNSLRDAIKRYFVRRRCFTFVLPTSRVEDLKALDSASPHLLTKEFTENLDKLREFVYKCKPKLMLNGSKTTGKGLVSMARTYVQCIRNGAMPSVGDAVKVIAEERNRKLSERAQRSFISKIRQIALPEENLDILDSLYKQFCFL